MTLSPTKNDTVFLHDCQHLSLFKSLDENA